MRSMMLCAGLGLVLLSGCAGNGAGIDGGCAWARPIYVSRADVLTEETAQQLLAHNEAGSRLCGWKPAH